MKININDNYWIMASQHEYTAFQKRETTSKDGIKGSAESIIGHYARLSRAVNAIATAMILNTKLKAIDFVDYIKQLEDNSMNIAKELKYTPERPWELWKTKESKQ